MHSQILVVHRDLSGSAQRIAVNLNQLHGVYYEVTEEGGSHVPTLETPATIFPEVVA